MSNHIKTQTEIEKNRKYQQRYKQKRKLMLRAFEFMERISAYQPSGLEFKNLRKLNIKARSVLNLPYKWTEQDLARAYKALDLLEKDAYGDIYQSFSPEYEELLTAVMEVYHNYAGTTEERAQVTFEIMRLIGTELNSKFGQNKPNAKGALFLAMASGMTPCTEWVKSDLVQFITDNFSEEERKIICEKILQAK
ncbi:MAG: hypothetical protein MJ048_05800 [Acidaminococcaceae bacterium]|nr:hypothetical protein [Acidaminococcaceae bacterium]